ncbi:MAG TPA: hypothetical protein VFQ13_02230 [Anaerolineales bacterium]|nr:hypothetical protein [Anaerolineales bacterium]
MVTNITPLFILGLLLLGVSIWELLRSGQKILKIGWRGWVNIFLTLGAKNRQPVDVSHLLIPPPAADQKNIEELKSLGFRRLGEAEVKSPFRPPLHVWVFAHVENRIQAEAAGRRVGFSTYFQEKTLVVTDFPNGEHIEDRNYQSHTIVTSISDAYHYHLQQIEKFSRKCGPPHPVQTMNDYLRWEVVGRKNYAMRKLSRWITSNLVRLVAFVYGCLVLILTPIFFEPPDFPLIAKLGFLSSQEILIYSMILLASPAILATRYFSRWTASQTHKDSRLLRKAAVRIK